MKTKFFYTFGSLAIAALVVAVLPLSAQQKPVIRLCTGTSSGTYIKVGRFLKEQLDSQADVQVVESTGSKNNFQKMDNGECDAAIVQSDALLWSQVDVEADVDVPVVNVTPEEGLFREYVHLLCPKTVQTDSETRLGIGGDWWPDKDNDEITSLDNLIEIAEHFTDKGSAPSAEVLMPSIITGGNGSGAEITFAMMKHLNEDLKVFPTESVTGDNANLAAYEKVKRYDRRKMNKNYCSMFVQMAPASWLQDRNDRATDYQQVQLMEIKDGTYDNKSDYTDAKGNYIRIYGFEEFTGETYSNFRSGEDRWTIYTKAMVVFRNDAYDSYYESNYAVIEAFEDAVARAAKKAGSF